MIFLKDDYFPFGYIFNLDKPDLVINNDMVELHFVTGIESGNGILCMKDENIEANTKFKNCKISDFTPTLLYLLGLPIPKDMDGKVLTKIFKKPYIQENPTRYEEANTKTREQEPYSEEDAKTISERLERLGYF